MDTNKELELLQEYDLDTGEVQEHTVNRITNDEAESLLARAEALNKLKSTPGWLIVDDFISTQIASHTAKLITEDKFSEVRRIQEYLKALTNIQSFVDITISEASQYAENLSQQSQDPE